MNVLELYRRLPRTNCGKCPQKACMPFAVALAKGDATAEACPGLTEGQRREIVGGSAKGDWRETVVAGLRTEVAGLAFAEIAPGLGAALREGAMTIRCLGRDYRVAPCLGHDTCGDLEACPQGDDTEAVLAPVYAADGLLLATPVYYENVSAQMKAFIDRNVFQYNHDVFLTPKVVGLLAVTAETGLDDTLSALRRFVALWVRPSILPDNFAEALRTERPVIYALEKRSVIDLAVLEFVCRERSLAMPLAPLGSGAFLPASVLFMARRTAGPAGTSSGWENFCFRNRRTR